MLDEQTLETTGGVSASANFATGEIEIDAVLSGVTMGRSLPSSHPLGRTGRAMLRDAEPFTHDTARRSNRPEPCLLRLIRDPDAPRAEGSDPPQQRPEHKAA